MMESSDSPPASAIQRKTVGGEGAGGAAKQPPAQEEDFSFAVSMMDDDASGPPPRNQGGVFSGLKNSWKPTFVGSSNGMQSIRAKIANARLKERGSAAGSALKKGFMKLKAKAADGAKKVDWEKAVNWIHGEEQFAQQDAPTSAEGAEFSSRRSAEKSIGLNVGQMNGESEEVKTDDTRCSSPIMTDSAIGAGTNQPSLVGRDLQSSDWLPSGGGIEDGGIEDGGIEDGGNNDGQLSPSQFDTSATDTFDDALYTTKLDSNTVTADQRQQAETMAAEMEAEGQHADMEDEAGVLKDESASIMTDSAIGAGTNRPSLVGRDLQAPDWLPSGGGIEDGGIEDVATGDGDQWDQFSANASQFGTSTDTFDDALYTTKLDSNTVTADQRQQAETMAAEMEAEGQHADMEDEAGVLEALDSMLGEGEGLPDI
jgi:PAB1-binding protein PBP1